MHHHLLHQPRVHHQTHGLGMPPAQLKEHHLPPQGAQEEQEEDRVLPQEEEEEDHLRIPPLSQHSPRIRGHRTQASGHGLLQNGKSTARPAKSWRMHHTMALVRNMQIGET